MFWSWMLQLSPINSENNFDPHWIVQLKRLLKALRSLKFVPFDVSTLWTTCNYIFSYSVMFATTVTVWLKVMWYLLWIKLGVSTVLPVQLATPSWHLKTSLWSLIWSLFVRNVMRNSLWSWRKDWRNWLKVLGANKETNE